VSASDIHLGSVPAASSGWQVQADVDEDSGQIAITLFSVTPISVPGGGSLVSIDFHVRPGAAAGASVINLAGSVHLSGRPVFATAVDDDQGPFTLHPAPTDGFDPGLDGSVLVGPAVTTSEVQAGTAAAGATAGGGILAGNSSPAVLAPLPNERTVPGSVGVATQPADAALPMPAVFAGGAAQAVATPAAQHLADQVFLALGVASQGRPLPADNRTAIGLGGILSGPSVGRPSSSDLEALFAAVGNAAKGTGDGPADRRSAVLRGQAETGTAVADNAGLDNYFAEAPLAADNLETRTY
jgi:hypothetical protein